MWLFILTLLWPQVVIMTAQILQIYIKLITFARWQLYRRYLATIIVSVKSKNFSSSIYRDNFCPSKLCGTRQRSGAELTCISQEQIWMIRLWWKREFSLPPWQILMFYLGFFFYGKKDLWNMILFCLWDFVLTCQCSETSLIDFILPVKWK